MEEEKDRVKDEAQTQKKETSTEGKIVKVFIVLFYVERSNNPFLG
jgi:hypothetical protein